jgi:hypothetical protein
VGVSRFRPRWLTNLSNALKTSRVDETESADAVVDVRRQALSQARAGLVFALSLLAGIVVIHPEWHVGVLWGVVDLAMGTWAATGAVGRFRSDLRAAEPLPHEAVEVVPTRQGLIRLALVTLAPLALLAAFPDEEWALQAAVTAAATIFAFWFVQPLVQSYLAWRWERSHGRLFRFLARSVDEEDADVSLYVADHAVPAA